MVDNFLDRIIDLELIPGVLDPIPQLLALFTAVHVVVLQLVRTEERGHAVVQGDGRPIEPRAHPLPQPPEPPAIVMRQLVLLLLLLLVIIDTFRGLL